ncbi:hypothetical protein [Jiangella alba]|uniref:hypothetical protein n=1 Tax=Jiangella alba TaxID=561176 RepID=UPI001C0C7BAF|nr:hypothetical protein [Jiangella alba]
MRTVSRLLVLAALLLGLVAMHHVAGAGHTDGREATAAAAHAEHEPSPSGHGLAHLCLAVLTAAALVLAGRLRAARLPDVVGRPRDAFVAGWTRWARPPPRPHGAALLTSLCVQRT